MTLNLTAKGIEQEELKKFLEENASEVLAEKINNGVRIVKDGVTLISRKTLDGFMRYATEEAKKQAEKGARGACIHSDVVFGWAIHYFEEEAIEEEIFNLDGTPYQAPKTTAPKVTTKKAPTTAKTTAEKPKAPTPKQTPTATEKTAQNEKKAVVLPMPKVLEQPEPTEAYRSLPKPTKKDKPTDTDQISIFDLF